MYDFYDKGDRHVTLRPEGTAPVVRSYVENKKFAPEVQKPFKVYYTGSMFRYERPQAGRLREFHQIGVENFGQKILQRMLRQSLWLKPFLTKLVSILSLSSTH
jgi:histidyl-tRNA synthetase